MKAVIRIVIIVVVFGVTGLLIYYFAKKKQDAKDRENLNGMTRSEFFDVVRPEWKTKWIEGTKDYISDMPVRYTITDKAGGQTITVTYNIGQGTKEILPEMSDRITITSDNWKSNILKDALKSGKTYQEELESNVNYLWKKDKPNPMEVDWAKAYWLPQLIDGIGINYNNELVQKLIYKI